MSIIPTHRISQIRTLPRALPFSKRSKLGPKPNSATRLRLNFSKTEQRGASTLKVGDEIIGKVFRIHEPYVTIMLVDIVEDEIASKLGHPIIFDDFLLAALNSIKKDVSATKEVQIGDQFQLTIGPEGTSISGDSRDIAFSHNRYIPSQKPAKPAEGVEEIDVSTLQKSQIIRGKILEI